MCPSLHDRPLHDGQHESRQRRPFLVTSTPGSLLKKDSKHTLRLEVRKNWFFGYLDDERVLTFRRDSRFVSKGQLGLQIANCKARIDNLEVRPLTCAWRFDGGGT